MVFASIVLGAHMLLQSAAFQLSIQGLAKAPSAESTLATVDGVAIKAKDVEDLLWESHGSEILSEVMYLQIAIAEGKKKGVIVTQEEIDKGVAGAIEEFKATLPPGQDVQQALAQSGQSKSIMALRIKANLILTKIALQDFEPKNFVKVSTIIVRPNSNSATDITSAIQVVQKAYDRIKAGEKWERLIEELTVDANSRQNRGLLGWRSTALFPKVVQDEMETLQSGSVTKPVQTDFGIQIFRIEAKGSGLNKEEIEKVKQEVLPFLQQQTTNRIRSQVKVERMYPPKNGGS